MHDIHIQPGGYHTDQVADDITAGALYETGLQMYMAGAWGPEGDFLGHMLCNGMHSIWPDFQPKRILDMGCGAGNSTLPWGKAFPDAEVHAIDVGAPMLRYAHTRAESLGVAVHFSQQNAECTDYDDGSFDLVVSHIMLHETSKKALPRIFAETRRLLRSGGRMLHFDIPRGDTLFDQFMHDWESYNNNESFARCMTDIDLVAEAVKGGWPADEVGTGTHEVQPGRHPAQLLPGRNELQVAGRDSRMSAGEEAPRLRRTAKGKTAALLFRPGDRPAAGDPDVADRRGIGPARPAGQRRAPHREGRGCSSREDIDQFLPDAEAEAQRENTRKRYIARVMRVIQNEKEEKTRGGRHAAGGASA